MRRVCLAGWLCSLAVAGCGEDIPSSPTWFDSVQTLVNQRCAVCHGADPAVPQVAAFRLDRYVRYEEYTLDAYDYRHLMVKRAVDLEAPAMPPGGPLPEREREILRRWVQQGAAKGTRDNSAPNASAIQPMDAPLTIDQRLDLTLNAWDGDGDGLTVAIAAREKGAAGGDVFITNLGGGTRQVQLDTGSLASRRTFEIVAVVDDGFFDQPADNKTEVVLLANVFVDHGNRGTAPRVVLLAPNGGSTLVGTTTIRWSASDPDPGDRLTIDLELLVVDAYGNEVSAERIAAGLANDPTTFDWDTSMVPALDGSGRPIPYKVRVTASDREKNTRSDVSDAPFTIAPPGTTTLTWADVKPFFHTYCKACHGEPALAGARLEYFRLDKYSAADREPPANNDLGVFEQRGLIYRRLVETGTMPPASQSQPTAAEVKRIAEWIEAGAPQGNPQPGP